MLILLQLRFLNLLGNIIKLNTICPQNPFLHYTMHLFIHILLQFNWDLCHQPATNLPTTEKSSPGDLLRLTTRLQVNSSFCKFEYS